MDGTWPQILWKLPAAATGPGSPPLIGCWWEGDAACICWGFSLAQTAGAVLITAAHWLQGAAEDGVLLLPLMPSQPCWALASPLQPAAPPGDMGWH